MKNITRILLVLLSLVMVLSCFAGCKKDGEDDNKDGAVTTTSSGGGEAAGDYECELPSDLNYDGEEITIISRDMPAQSDEFVSEGESDNIILSSVYRRNKSVEARLGVKLNVIAFADDSENNHSTVMAKVVSDISGGAGEYDIVTAPAYTAMPRVIEGVFCNLKEVENLNLGKFYWAQGFNEYAQVGDAQYITTGAIALSLYRFMYVTVYNNSIFAQKGLEDIYTKVKNNTWTLEEQYEMSKELYVDDGDDSGVADIKDSYGFVSGARTSVDAYLAAFDVNIVGKDSDGYFSYIANQDKFVGVADKIIKLFFNNKGAYIFSKAEDNTDNAGIADMFVGGKVAMASMKVQALEERLRKVDFEYSIAPLPKYDSNQENFGTYVQDQVTIMGLPITKGESEMPMLGAVMECLADESYKQTYPAYFETALSYQYLQNQESVEMLQIIYESIDLSPLHACYATDVSWNSMLRLVAESKFNTISRQFASTAKNAGSIVDERNQNYRDLLAG